MAGESKNKDFSIEVAQGEYIAIPLLDLVRQGNGNGGGGTPEISFLQPENGSLELIDGALVYTPGDTQAGTIDSFVYWVGQAEEPPASARTASVTITAPLSLGGSGQDGYISGATVWSDANENGLLDASEASTTTNSTGDFFLEGGDLTGTLYLTGGVDIATLLPFDGVLRAPAGSTVITPITTLVVAVMEADTTSLTQADAESLVKSSLGLADVNITDYDPIAVLSDPAATSEEQQAAEDIFATGSQILNTVSITGSAVSGASDGNATVQDAEDSAFASLANLVLDADTGGTTVDLTNSDTVNAVVVSTALAESVDPLDPELTEVTQVVAASNTAVEDAVNDPDADPLTAISEISQVAQGETTEAVADGEVSEEELTDYTTDLATQVDQAVVGDVDGSSDPTSDDELIIGTPEADELDGGVGNDTISGQGGDDILIGGDGDDTVSGGAGRDTLLAGLGNNTYDGGSDFDVVDYASASSAITANLQSGEVSANGFGGTDTLVNIEKVIGSAFGDTLTGGDVGIQRFEPGDGADTIIGGTGGNDGVDYRSADAGTNTGINANLLTGEIVDPWGNTDSVSSIERVFGTAFDDTVTGTDGPNEFVIGGDGNDSFVGNGGLDIFIPGPGEDVFDGGDGFDLRWSDLQETQGVEIDLRIDTSGGAFNVINDGHGSGGVIVNVESIDGGILGDSLIGDDNNNEFYGLLGPDFISGGGGNDLLYGGDPGGLDDDSADILIDGAGSDTLFGGAGADTFIIEGGGDDTIGDFEFFPDASEKVDLSTLPIFVTPEAIQAQLDNNQDPDDQQTFLQLGLDATLSVGASDWGPGEELTLDHIILPTAAEGTTVDGTSGDDSAFFGNQDLIGDSGDDTINGLEGGDTLVGGAGNDTLNGGPGADFMIGGQGDDIIDGGADNDPDWASFASDHVNPFGGAFVNLTGIELDFGGGLILAAGTAIDPDRGVDTLIGIDNIFGSEGRDGVVGSVGANHLVGAGGDDVLIAIDGDDILDGGDGNDELRGGEGNDQFYGGAGADNLVVSNGSAFIGDFTPGEDTIDLRETTAPVPDFGTITANATERVETEDDGQGGTVDVTYTDIVLGSLVITLRGVAIGDLSETDFVNYQATDPDTNLTGTPGDDSFTPFEADPLFQTGTGADTVTALGGNDYIETGIGNDIIDAGEGDFDSLAGGPGDDLLNGGPGTGDDANYGSFQFFSQRGVIVNLSDRTDITDFDGGVVDPGTARDPDGGTDTLVGIENLSGGDFDDWLIGDIGDNFISGWYGNDLLEGMGGNDNFAPGSGSDEVYGDGDDGVDYYDYGGQFANQTGIVVNLGLPGFTNGGAIPVVLGPGQVYDQDGFVDNLYGISNIFGTAYDDAIVGSPGDNFISGLEGDDKLSGLGGNDFISGGEGADLFRINSGSTYIPDFAPGEDQIDFQFSIVPVPDFATIQVGFTDDGTSTFIDYQGFSITLEGVLPGQLTAADFTGFRPLDANQTIDGTAGDDNFSNGTQLEGGSGNDVISGLAGNDDLLGNAGDDTLNGGDGSDWLYGGLGSDQLDGGDAQDVDGDDWDGTGFSFGYGSSVGIYLNLSDSDGWDFGNGVVLDSGQVLDPGGDVDSISGIEHIDGTEFDDQFIVGGGDGGFFLAGYGGNDGVTVSGPNGVTFAPGTGDNFFDGGNVGSELNMDSWQFPWDGGVDVYLSEPGFEGQAFGPDSFTAIYNVENVYGSAFNDNLYGNNQGNGLNGQEGDDFLSGAAGDDYLNGGNGEDRISAGSGDDYAVGGPGNDTFVVGNGSLFIEDWESGDLDFSETVNPVPDAATIEAARDTYTDGDGNPHVTISLPGLFIDILGATPGDVTAANYTGFVAIDDDQTITGTSGDDDFPQFDGDSDEALLGGTGNDTINGLGGNDNLVGFAGNDTLNGGNGSDWIEGGPGNDTIDGGDADDVEGDDWDGAGYYSNGYGSSAGVHINLSDSDGWDFGNGVVLDRGQALDPDGGLDTITGIEHIDGTDYDDQFAVGGDGTGFFFGGGAGNDGLVVSGPNGVTFAPGTGDNFFDGGNVGSELNMDSWQFPWDGGVDVYLSEPGFEGQAFGPDSFTAIYNVENVYGSAFNDNLYGNNQGNGLNGQEGDDFLSGAAGDDYLNGGNGEDRISAGSGDDYAVGGPGNDTFVVGNGSLFIEDWESGDLLDFSETVNPVPDAATIEAARDTYTDGDGNPHVTISLPGLFIDILGATPGDVTAANYTGFVAIDDDQTITGTSGDDDFPQFDGDSDEALLGGTGNDTINGLGGNDNLVGFAGNDTLNGGNGSDWIEGGPGNDTIDGGDADDVEGDDWDGAGYYSNGYGSSAGVHINLSDSDGWDFGNGVVLDRGQALDPDGGLDTITGIEHIDGTDYDDQFAVGGDGTGFFFGGGAGNDGLVVSGPNGVTFAPGTGDNFFDGGNVGSELNMDSWQFPWDGGVDVYLSEPGFEGQAFGPDSFTAIYNVENVYGSAFNDNLYGNNQGNGLNGQEGDDFLEGFGGDDTLIGGDGDDTVSGGAGRDTLLAGLGNNTYDGGSDFDVVDYASASSAITANLQSGEVSANGFGGTDTLVNIEKVIGSAFDDTLTGGDVGIQRFEPGDGADTIIGGTGGNDGVDYRSADAGTSTGIDANLLTGEIVDPWGNIDSVSSVERVFGTAFDDTVTGTDGPNEFVIGGDGNDSFVGNGGLDIYIPGPGEDVFDGGDGFDLYWSDLQETQGVEIDLRIDTSGGAFNVINDGHGSGGVIVNVESIDGGVLGDSLIGDDNNNEFYGLLGPDFISGGGGDDLLHGGAPNQYDDDSADTLIDGAGSDTLFGGAGADTFIIEGGGDDTISDFEFFGDFSEKIDLTTLPIFISADALQQQLDDQDPSDGQTVLQLGPNVTLTVTGPSWNPDEELTLDHFILPVAPAGATIGGTAGDDSAFFGNPDLIGDSGDDTINGLEGGDTLVGGAGSDTLNGGPGADFMIGGPGDDIIDGGVDGDPDWASYTSDRHIDAFNGAYVNLSDVQQQAGDGTILAAGTAIDPDGGVDQLSNVNNVFGSDGADAIFGSAVANEITSFGGDDQIFGLDGDDVLDAGPGNDYISGAEGNDQLYAADGDDTLIDGAGDDFLDGGPGADTFLNEGGNDFLTGGDGQDTFAFGGATGNDVIADFNPADDYIQLLNGLAVSSVAPVDTNGDTVDDSTLITFNDPEVSTVELSDILLLESEITFI